MAKDTHRQNGLSPRGRGKPFIRRSWTHDEGSIPAWAGETLGGLQQLRPCEVYPRVGGGNRLTFTAGVAEYGLSPRGRGKRLTPRGRLLITRSIPAWAGETSSIASIAAAIAVYPRVGGGNELSAQVPNLRAGLSPRGRGKRYPFQRSKGDDGSIPAWAGETYPDTGFGCCRTVYPRVGGGNESVPVGCPLRWGLSPRGRGKRTAAAAGDEIDRSIPAWAGETKTDCRKKAQREVYPRVGGGNLEGIGLTVQVDGLSPRGRGKLIAYTRYIGSGRSIPAWAGETRRNPARF